MRFRPRWVAPLVLDFLHQPPGGIGFLRASRLKTDRSLCAPFPAAPTVRRAGPSPGQLVAMRRLASSPPLPACFSVRDSPPPTLGRFFLFDDVELRNRWPWISSPSPKQTAGRAPALSTTRHGIAGRGISRQPESSSRHPTRRRRGQAAGSDHSRSSPADHGLSTIGEQPAGRARPSRSASSQARRAREGPSAPGASSRICAGVARGRRAPGSWAATFRRHQHARPASANQPTGGGRAGKSVEFSKSTDQNARVGYRIGPGATVSRVLLPRAATRPAIRALAEGRVRAASGFGQVRRTAKEASSRAGLLPPDPKGRTRMHSALVMRR